MAKDSFILYLDQKEIFGMLEDEEAGQLIKAIFEYEEAGQMPKLDKSLRIAFIPIKNALDRNKEKYQKVVERNKQNIEKRWNKENTKNTTGKNGIRKNTKNTDNDNEHDNDSDNEHDSVNDNDNIVSDSCVDGLQKVIDFYNENIGLITPYGIEILEDYSKDMQNDLIIYAMQISVEANKKTIQYIKAILNNWSKAGIKTLMQAKEEHQKGKTKKTKCNYNQREYDNLDFLYKNEVE